MLRLVHVFACVLVATLLTACAGVTVSSVSTTRYLTERRGDVLTTGRLSEASQEVLRVVGVANCREAKEACRITLRDASGVSDEQRLSTLSELWLEAALAADRAPDRQDAALDAWLETARHAYAYLFFTARRPGERAFEDRQTQVRDYYNFAVQRTMVQLFKRTQAHPLVQPTADPQAGVKLAPQAGWTIEARVEGLSRAVATGLPEELIPASTLRFTGLRNTYSRDGFGAELVAVLGAPAREAKSELPPVFEEMRFPSVTALLQFPGESLGEVLTTRSVQLRIYDPNRTAQVKLGAESVPLAADFTAGYGLWLARSGFAVQSLRTLFGLSDGIVRPRVHLMQPFDPERRVIVMLHGLASSPEAWINVANEVLGDELLRRNFQIWQVYYPTNAPLALNRHAIREALLQTLNEFDPGGRSPASRDMVLVGHSMGGVLGRMLVSSSGDSLLNAIPHRVKGVSVAQAEPYLRFEPLPQVSEAIFIAAPHRGTPFANKRIARRVANMVTLPVAVLEGAGDLAGLLIRFGGESGMDRIPNSIDNLSDTDPFVVAASSLPISPAVKYHSIVGHDDVLVPIADSSDGIVPYASAHLPGAASELVLPSGHSVQEQPKAILEVRRILRESLLRTP